VLARSVFALSHFRSRTHLTCKPDRNALVWEPSPTGYKPTLVLLRIARAATCVRWSPSETKFAVGSGDRVIAICYFEEENDWWVSKHLKKPIRSTITSVSWHPNSVLLAAGSTDAHARVFSSFIKGVDARPDPSVWGERLPFNTVCGEFMNNSAGWVHSVAFSPSGDALAFAAHDSSITVVYPTAPEQPPRAVISINTQLLPFMNLIWNGEDELIAAGYDCEAFRFKGGASGWQLSGTLESKGGAGLDGEREESALNMFKQMDLKGKVKDDTQLKTVHQNTISTLRVYESNGTNVTKFSSEYSPLFPASEIVLSTNICLSEWRGWKSGHLERLGYCLRFVDNQINKWLYFQLHVLRVCASCLMNPLSLCILAVLCTHGSTCCNVENDLATVSLRHSLTRSLYKCLPRCIPCSSHPC
jgi:actin related protein 2/3 complex, subunit 1A/1B